MSDDFLYRMRAAPPAHFVAGLKARLNQLDQESLLRVPVPRRVLFLGSMIIAAVALATAVFMARTLYSPPSNDLRPIPATKPSPVNDQRTGSAPKATDASPAALGNTVPGKAGVRRIPGQFDVGATVSIYPNIKEAVRYMNKNLNLNPTFPEPVLSMMSDSAVFASLCAGSTSVEAVVVDRRISREELEVCRRINKHITEIRIGYEAIALARSSLYDAPKLSPQSIFLALAREIPDPRNPEELIENPYVTWDQVDAALPNERIDVSGPPLSAATGIAFRNLVMKAGCSSLPTIALLKGTNPERFEEVCGSVRSDGAYRVSDLSQLSSNPFDFVGYLQAHPEAIAVLGYRQELLRAWKLSAGSIGGVVPSDETISSGSYPGARALYLYANTAVPHMRDFVLAIWSSVGGPSGDTPLISIDAEPRYLRQQVLTLPDLIF